MRIYLLLLFGLSACQHPQDLLPSVSGDTITKNDVFDAKESSPFSGFQTQLSPQALVNPDSSFAVELSIQEGVVEAFMLIHPDTSCFYKVKLPNDILGGVDYTREIWENDSLLVLPNIGGTATGHYQMTINRRGVYAFQLVPR